jgi:hypothetical protein
MMFIHNPILPIIIIVAVILIAIEASEIHKASETGFWKSLGLAFLMNLISVAFFIGGYFATLKIMPGITLFFFASGISIVIATFINTHVFDRFTNLSRNWLGAFSISILACIATIFIASLVPHTLNARHAALMSRAKGTLRSIGSSELAYKDANTNRLYGSFDALKDTQFIPEGYSEGNIIENYSLSWHVNNISTVVSEEFPAGIESSFTVIAWPRDIRRGIFSTFGITEDQVVRVFNSENGNRLDDVKTWDPIL